MLAVMLVIAVAALAGGVAALLLGNRRRFTEVDRFHRASRMTSEWARNGVTSPVLRAQPNRRDAPVEAEQERS